MKKVTTALLALALMGAMSCKKDKDDEVQPTSDMTELSGDLATQTLDASKKYLLKGTVFVQDGQTLTIPAGTVLMGDKKTKATLVINKGGKIDAQGTASNPIVMTSNQPVGERDKGDWGGLILLGKANVNQNNPSIEGISPAVNFGTFNSTANDADNSGILKYVRVEFAGIALSPNNETNSFTFGGVGSGTQASYLQASYGGDDSFEWFGGVINVDHIVAYSGWDDDFDTDFGFSGNVQFALSVRDPFAADQSGSNGFESDNEANGNDVLPYTSAVFSNVTILGPVFDSTKSASTQNSGNYQHSMHLRRRTNLSIFNSVIAGFPIGLNLDGATTKSNYITNNTAKIQNTILVNIGQRAAAKTYYSGAATDAAVATYFTTGTGNVAYTNHNVAGKTKGDSVLIGSAYVKYANAYKLAGINPSVIMGFEFNSESYPSDPNFATAFTGETQTGASFTDAKVSGSFFTATSYRGAFGTTDWTDSWTSFGPKMIAY